MRLLIDSSPVRCIRYSFVSWVLVLFTINSACANAETDLIWSEGNWDETVWAAELLDSDNDGVEDSDDDFPYNAAIALDTDGDGLADDYVASCDLSCQSASTVIIDDDDDNDGIPDVDDELPLDPSNAISRPAVEGELLKPLGNATATPVLFAFDESAGSYSVTPLTTENTVTFSGDYRQVWLYELPDMNGNGAVEYGLFGIRSDAGFEERLQFFIRDSQTGNRVSVLNWLANWGLVSLVVLDDVTGDGIVDIGLQGYFQDGFRPQLVVKNGATGGSHQTYSFPNLWSDAQYVGFSDVTGDGYPEVALYGAVKRTGKMQVKVIDGRDKNNKLKAYNFPANWTKMSWHNVGDYNGDGEDDWGMLGHAIADSRWQLVIKDGTEPRGALAIYAWPDMSDVTLMQLADANDDGVKELALGGLNSKGRWQLQIKDGQDRNNTIKNITWPDNWNETSLHVVGDVDGDGKDEVSLFGEMGSYQLVIKLSSSDYSTETTIDLGSDWAAKPTLSQFDTDGDALPEWMAWGLNGSNEIQVNPIALP